MKIAVAQLGARRHYAIPKIFQRAGILERLYTDIYLGNKPWLSFSLARLPASLRGKGVDQILSRQSPALPPEKILSFERLGLNYTLKNRHAESKRERRLISAQTATKFNQLIISAGLEMQILFGDFMVLLLNYSNGQNNVVSDVFWSKQMRLMQFMIDFFLKRLYVGPDGSPIWIWVRTTMFWQREKRLSGASRIR